MIVFSTKQDGGLSFPPSPPQFQISARAETINVIATKFQPGGRAEIRHVIGPLVQQAKFQRSRFPALEQANFFSSAFHRALESR